MNVMAPESQMVDSIFNYATASSLHAKAIEDHPMYDELDSNKLWCGKGDPFLSSCEEALASEEVDRNEVLYFDEAFFDEIEEEIEDDQELQERLEELSSGDNRGVQPGDLERLDELFLELLQDPPDVAYDDSSQVCIVCGTIGHGASSCPTLPTLEFATHSLDLLWRSMAASRVEEQDSIDENDEADLFSLSVDMVDEGRRVVN